MRFGPNALPLPLRFHDLRGTTATLLARAGAPLVVAQRILRHSDPRLTANIYSRVDLGDLREGLNRIDIPAMPKLMAANAPPLVPLVSTPASRAKARQRDATNNSREIKNLRQSGRQDLNLRPLGPESDSECSAGLASGGTEAQALDIIGSVERANPSDGIGATPDQRRFVPAVSPRNAELPEHLLTVREVAEHLGVCAATVYKLCATGELLHLRISNAVRIAP